MEQVLRETTFAYDWLVLSIEDSMSLILSPMIRSSFLTIPSISSAASLTFLALRLDFVDLNHACFNAIDVLLNQFGIHVNLTVAG